MTIAVTAALLGALAGCGSGVQPDDGPGGTVQVWALQDPQNEPIIQRGILAFNSDSGTGARLTTYSNDAYKDKLQATMGSTNAPDVFFNWGGGNLAQYVHSEQVEPLTAALLDRQDVARSFLPSVLAVGKVDGVQYGLPMNGIQPVMLFYNKKVFSDAHVKPPKTFDDLLDLVDVFKSRDITPIALAGSQGWTELMWLEYILDRVGGAAKFADIAAGKSGAWRDPAVVKAVKMCQDLVKAGAFGTKFASVNYDNTGASKLLATGQAAMHLMGSWEYSSQASSNPGFAKADLGWAEFPSVSGGSGSARSVVGNPSNYFSVRSNSPVSASAIRFVIETMSSDGYISDLIKAGQVPAVKGVEDLLAKSDNAKFAEFTYELAVKAPTFTQSWDQALSPTAGAELNTNLQKLFQSEISPEQFVAAMEKTA